MAGNNPVGAAVLLFAARAAAGRVAGLDEKNEAKQATDASRADNAGARLAQAHRFHRRAVPVVKHQPVHQPTPTGRRRG